MKKGIYLISENNGTDNHAGPKARNDIEYFLQDNVSEILIVSRFFNSEGIFNKFKILYTMLIEWSEIIYKIEKNSSVIIQYPLESPKEVVNFFVKIMKRVKKVNIIAVIHDLESLRFDGKRKSDEIRYLSKFDNIIVHNLKMKEYLKEKGIDENRLVVLEIFDYKADKNFTGNRELSNEVVIAGNLSSRKSEYVYKLNKLKSNVRFNLFGPNYVENNDKNVKYFGQFPPDELPSSLEGSFGLVWDGTEIYDCIGITGKYLKYNNPHKLSLYIVSRLPIIIWRQAALSEFVTRENIGIVIDSLEDIDNEIKKLTNEDYKDMINNIERISLKIENGYYIKHAIESIFK